MPPANTDPALLPAHVLAAEIDADRLSPVDVVDALLARIRGSDQKLHAYVEVYADEARLAAEAADKAIRSGHRIGPLHGIPIALKDLIEIEGRVTTGGSQVWHDRRSTYTATIAKRMIAAGMIVLGKTHTVEFAMGGWGTNQHRGTPWNPWDPAVARTPGGSSSGTGVAVAAVPGAVGDRHRHRRLGQAAGLLVRAQRAQDDDRAGQHLRHPAVEPEPRHAGADGALGRGRGTAVPGDRGPRSRTIREPWGGRPAGPLPTMRRGVRGLKLARMPAVERDHVEAQVLNAYDSAIDTLARLGAEIVTVNLPRRFADYTQLTGRIIGAESYFLVGDLIDDMSLPIDEAVRPRIASGRGMSARDYLAALREQAAAKREFARGPRRRRCIADPDDDDRGDPARRGRPEHDPGAFHPLCQRARNLRARRPRRLYRQLGCRCRCRSSAAPMTRRPPSASAGPTNKRPIGTTAARPACG